MGDYLPAAVMQLYVNNNENDFFTEQPEITFFRSTYVAPDVFIKDEIVLKNVPVNWDDIYYLKIPRDIHMLGKIWVNVTIPYFQIIKKNTKNTTIVTNDANLNEMLYDNHNTYLINYNDVWYLIPDIFLQLPNLMYTTMQLHFCEIKNYFIPLIGVNMNDDTNILLLSFNVNNYYTSDIIPLMLNISSSYNKIILNNILNGNERYKKNMLTQNSFDYYITKKVENILMDNYQNIKKYDQTIDSELFNIMSTEFNILYNNKDNPNSDIAKTHQYINDNINLTDSVIIIKENTILYNSLVLKMIISMMNPDSINTYEFYKKYAVFKIDSFYNFSLVDVNLVSGSITSSFPTYTVNISTLNLSFTLNTSMKFKTDDGLIILFTAPNIFTIQSVETTTTLSKINIIVNTNNNTYNTVNISAIFNDTNKNNEWSVNLLNHMKQLNYNESFNNYLFNDFVKNYNLKENVIINNNIALNETSADITNLWIELKTIETQFKKLGSEIIFTNYDFIEQKDIIANQYKNILNIETEPQDFSNIYSIIMNKFIDIIKNKYFRDIGFITLFYNKINSLVYMKYISIDTKPSLINYNGLLFYYNIDMFYYITKDKIKDYLLELFKMQSFIALIPQVLTSVNLSGSQINDYQTNTITDNTYCFNELKLINNYHYKNTDIIKLFTINGTFIDIQKSLCNYLFYRTNLVELIITINDIIYPATSYTIENDYVRININVAIGMHVTEIYLKEIIKQSIPYVAINDIGNNNGFIKVPIFDRESNSNMMINYNTVNTIFISQYFTLNSYESYNYFIYYFIYIINGQNTIIKGEYTGSNGLFQATLPTDYKSYDKIMLAIYKLPIREITMQSSDFYEPLQSTFPYIKLRTASDIYIDNSTYFTNNNTFYSITNAGPIIISSITAEYVELYIYSQVFVASGTYKFTIYDNATLPNFLNHSSYNSTVSCLMDYYLQKPMIVKMNSDNENAYMMMNIPTMVNQHVSGDGLLTYINKQLVYNIYDMHNNSLIRNNTTNVNYSTYYTISTLIDSKNIDSIMNVVIDTYDSLFSDIYLNIVDLIENSQLEYFKSYGMIINNIESKIYGMTTNAIYLNCQSLNQFELISHLSEYNIDINDVNLTNYDAYDILAPSLYNMININKQTLNSDSKLFTTLINKYFNAPRQFINLPWLNFKPYIKVNPLVYQYLDKYNNYAQVMMKDIKHNLSLLHVTNNIMFEQEYKEEYVMKDKYELLVNNVEKNKVKLLNHQAWDYVTTVDSPIYTSFNKDGHELKYDATADSNIQYISGGLAQYKYKPIYDQVKYNNINMYKLIGAVKIKNNLLEKGNAALPQYFVVDNMTVICTDINDINYFGKQNGNYYGINYNCVGLTVSSKITFTFVKMSRPLYQYIIVLVDMSMFNTSDKYMCSVNATLGYMYLTSTHLVILSNNSIVFDRNTTLHYIVTTNTNLVIFNNLQNNTTIVFTQNIVINDFKINLANKYNFYYNDITWAYNNFIMFDNNILLDQLYATQSYILDNIMVNVDKTLEFSCTILQVIQEDILSPLYIQKSHITYYNTLEHVDWIQNKNGWININNVDVQIKNFETISIPDKNYLLYYSESDIKPTIYKYPDIYTTSRTYNNIEYNVYLNSYIFPSTNPFTLTDTSQYTINGVKIHMVDNNNVFVEPFYNSFLTTITVQHGTTQYTRPFYISTVPLHVDYYITESDGTPIDSLLHITVPPPSTIMTFFINFTSPQEDAITYSSNIILVKVTDYRYALLILTDLSNITLDTFNIIEIFTSGERIILWLYKGTYGNFNIVSNAPYYASPGDVYLREPFYIDNRTLFDFFPLEPDFSIVNADLKYFTLNSPKVTTIPNIIISIVILGFDSRMNFDEAQHSTGLSAYDIQSNNIIGELNSWTYINHSHINNNIIESSELNNINYFIFIQNDKLYFNVKKQNITNGIELTYNMDIIEGDMFIYPYLPIYIKCTYSYEIRNVTIYIYTDTNIFQRNEIVMMGDNIVQIKHWSYFNSCFIGTIISQIINKNNNRSGYYSFGIWTNYLNKNKMIKGTNTKDDLSLGLFYGIGETYNISIGDYYIENNMLYRATSTYNTRYAFYMKSGCTTTMFYLNGLWYYDETLIYLEPYMTLIYNKSGINITLVIKSIDGDIVTFFDNVVPTNEKSNIYIPYQPFPVVTLQIVNNKIINYDFTGWFEFYYNGTLTIYRVENGTIIGNIPEELIYADFTGRIIDPDKMILKHDFHNAVYIDNPELQLSQKNDITPLLFDCTIYIDETYIYLKNTTWGSSYNFSNLKYCYFQSILIDNIWYRVIDINSKIYINVKSNNNTFIKNTVKVYISAGNVNDYSLISNNYRLKYTNKIEYPNIKPNIINTTYDDKIYNMSLIMAGDTTYLTYIINDVYIKFNSSDPTVHTLESNELFSTFVNYNFFPNMFKYYYFENYIPLNIDIVNRTFEILQLYVQAGNKILLQEITVDGAIYQHYVDIRIINYIIKITSSNQFHSIKKSVFYINNMLPCLVTNNMYIQMLQPEYKLSRTLNTVNKNTVNINVYVQTKLIAKPIRTSGKWKFQIAFIKLENTDETQQSIYDKIKHRDIYIDNKLVILTTSNNVYYIISSELYNSIDVLNIYDSAYIDSITITEKYPKPEYDKFNTTTFDKLFNVNNNLTVTHINMTKMYKVVNSNAIYFQDTTATKVLFNELPRDSYIGYSNSIISNNIINNDTYLITTVNNILDITSTATLYNYSVQYNYDNVDTFQYVPELSITLPSFETYIVDSSIQTNIIVNANKPWRDWTLITTRHDEHLKVFLNNYDLIYENGEFKTIQSNSYFTDNEIIELKTFMIYMINNISAYSIMNELYNVEIYLLTQLVYYLDQKYFWDNIVVIMKKIVEQYNGTYKWTIINNIVVIENEFILYPNNFNQVNGKYIRKNYLNREFDMLFEPFYIQISRSPAIIDSYIGYIVNNTKNYNMYGTRMDYIIATLLDYNVSLDNLTPILPINFKYMDSVKYFIAKLYYDMIKNNIQQANLNTLTQLDRKINFGSNVYYGKYFDNLFNERYYGYFGLQQHNIISDLTIDTKYVYGYIVGDLYNKLAPETDINLLETNNIFKYNIIVNNENYNSDVIINSSNQYTVDIRDNFNHIVDPLVANAYVNTDSIMFDSAEMVQSTNISIATKEAYTIVNSIHYGDMYNVTYDAIINSNNIIIFDNIKLLYLNTNIFVSPVIITTGSIIEIILNVVIIMATYENGRTYISMSSNYTADYQYIRITDVVYEIIQENNKYYIDEKIVININELYGVIKFITLTFCKLIQNKKVTDIILDRNIIPLEYNITDTTLPQSFTMDNIHISEAIIYTENSLRLYYGFNDVNEFNSIIYHNYRIRESIPYEIQVICELLRYYYTMTNKYNLTINDVMMLDNQTIAVNIYKITGNDIIFYLNTYVTTNELNNMNMTSIKIFNLEVIRYDGEIIYATIPDDIVNDENTFDIIDGDGTITSVEVTFTNYIIIQLPYPIANINNIKLRQIIFTLENSAFETKNNQAFLILTTNNTSHSNKSDYFIPTIQTLTSDLKEFDALYYYRVDTLLITFDYYEMIYILVRNNYIPAKVYLTQKYHIIIGTNEYISEQYVTIYDKYLTQKTDYLFLNETNYLYVQGELLESTSDISYVVLLPKNSVHSYTKLDNMTTNKVVLTFAYSKIEIKNVSYDVGFKKIPDNVVSTVTNNTSYHDIEWIQYLARNIFKSIEFSIDDDIVDKLDIDVLTIYATYMIDMFKRNDLIDMQKIRINPDGSYFFNMVIPLSFTHSPDGYLPVSSMGRSNVKIKFNLNNLSSLIMNKMDGYTKTVIPSIDFYYTFMTLESELLKRFDNNIMMLQPVYSYMNFLLNKPEEYNHITLLNRTTDVFFITKMKDGEQPARISSARDGWYSEYVNNSNYDNYIYVVIDAEIKSNSYRYQILKNHPIIGKYDTRFAMYLDQKYLQYIDENLNNKNLKFSNKLTLLTLYFTYIYMNINIKTNVDAIDMLNILVNGKEIQPNLHSEYNNYVVPYVKGYTLPDGYHLYSFAYNSLASQPNGFAFMKKIKDFLIYSKQNDIGNEYKMKICAREYKFIKIENNKATII